MSILSTTWRSTSNRQMYVLTSASSFSDNVDSQAATPSEVPKCKIVHAGTKFIAHLLKQLEEVRIADDTEDERQATRDAYDVARELLVNATIIAGRMGRAIPFGHVTTDPEGGVRIEWFSRDARVHLVIRATRDRGGYIYHRVAAEYKTEPATAYSLAKWLKFVSE